MKVQQLIKETCAIISEDVGTAKADQIAQAAQKRYEALCAKTRPIPKSSVPTLTSAFTLVLLYMKLYAQRASHKKRLSGIFANISSVLPPNESHSSNRPSKHLVLHAGFLASLNQVSRKAAHQVLDLPLNIQKVMVTKLASIL